MIEFLEKYLRIFLMIGSLISDGFFYSTSHSFYTYLGS